MKTISKGILIYAQRNTRKQSECEREREGRGESVSLQWRTRVAYEATWPLDAPVSYNLTLSSRLNSTTWASRSLQTV